MESLKFLKFHYIHRKTPVLVSLFNKTPKETRHQHMCFPENIVKFLRTTFFIEHLWLLLLDANKINNFKGTVMQTEKTVINVRLRVSKVS